MDQIVLTIDIDWAPDCAIDWIAALLVRLEVRATWFVTHQSPGVERLRDHPHLFELGVHPNFLDGSTHGATPSAVLQHCMELVPDATSLRTHSLVQSTPLLARIVSDTPITTDVSLFLPCMPNLRPFSYRAGGRPLLRLPYFWEDDNEMQQVSPCWRLARLLNVGPGLKVFDFHPVHVYMNAERMEAYRSLTSRVSRLEDLEEADLRGVIRAGEGTKSLFLELVEHLAASERTVRVRDVDFACRAAAEGGDD